MGGSSSVAVSCYWPYLQAKAFGASTQVLRAAVEAFGRLNNLKASHRVERKGEVSQDRAENTRDVEVFVARVGQAADGLAFSQDDFWFAFDAQLVHGWEKSWLSVVCDQAQCYGVTHNAEFEWLILNSQRGGEVYQALLRFVTGLAATPDVKNTWLVDKRVFAGDALLMYRPNRLVRLVEYPVLRDEASTAFQRIYGLLRQRASKDEIVRVLEDAGVAVQKLGNGNVVARFWEFPHKQLADAGSVLRKIERIVGPQLQGK